MVASERPREKSLMIGVNNLSNEELISLILGTGTKSESALDLAKRVLAYDMRGLDFLSVARIKDLKKIAGIGKAKALSLLAAVELGKRLSNVSIREKKRIHFPGDIAKMFIERLRNEIQENVFVILFNTQNEIIKEANISKGTVRSSLLDIRIVFYEAIRESAVNIVLLHNHPSGNLVPSDKDIEITKEVINAGKVLGIGVKDHIIVAGHSFVSMAEKKIVEFDNRNL
jgi:DNA repair protein RadC